MAAVESPIDAHCERFRSMSIRESDRKLVSDVKDYYTALRCLDCKRHLKSAASGAEKVQRADVVRELCVTFKIHAL